MVHHELMDSPALAPARGRLTAAAAGAAVVLALAGSAVAVAYDRAGTAVFADTVSFGVVLAVIAVVGAVVILAVPGNRTGWLLLAAAAVMGVGEAFTQAGIYGVRTSPGSVPGSRVPGRHRAGAAGVPGCSSPWYACPSCFLTGTFPARGGGGCRGPLRPRWPACSSATC